jgi:hypothetical protein
VKDGGKEGNEGSLQINLGSELKLRSMVDSTQ